MTLQLLGNDKFEKLTFHFQLVSNSTSAIQQHRRHQHNMRQWAHHATAVALRPQDRVFGIAELLEQILLELAREFPLTGTSPCKILFILQRVNATFKATIKASSKLQERMWLSLGKNDGDKDHHAPMRWLIRYLNVSEAPFWQPYDKSFGSSAWMGVELPTLNLSRDYRSQQIFGHTLRFDRLWAAGRRIRPSWWKMKMFRVEGALPLEVSFEWRYAALQIGRDYGEIRAKCHPDLTLGDFVSQYLKALKMTDDGDLREGEKLDKSGVVYIDMLAEKIGSAERPILIE